MSNFVDIALTPEKADDEVEIKKKLFEKGVNPRNRFQLKKRSIDARKKQVLYRLRFEVFAPDENTSQLAFEPGGNNVSNAEEVHIIGSGPCGLFAALELIEKGKKPIIIERGKDVRSRRRDLAALNRDHLVNPESNYCFGEGGAGTYSDGKLYTRSKKRGSVDRVLKYLVAFGASNDILIDAHPHIGTNKLPNIIVSIREYIKNCGGEIHFNTKLTGLEISGQSIQKIEINSDHWISVKKLILATGHSSRDVFELLHKTGIEIQSKPFALGVRIEHPQELIDQIQYHCTDRGPYLPPASYSLVNQYQDKGVYSFCMCPGGIIAPCATSPGEVVTNGWSPSKRNNPFANSGLVVSVNPKDFDPKNSGDPLLGLGFQSEVEKKAWDLGGRRQSAPAQRLADFVSGKESTNLPKCSYQPGIVSAKLNDCLPDFIYKGLANSLKEFGKKMKGYYTNEAVLVATESRTSSPVRIPRTKELHHPDILNLYPAGEGAGYAGGIVSAAIDGQKIAETIGNLKTSPS